MAVDHQVLIVVVAPDRLDRETSAPEQSGQGACAEVVAVLVVHVPEGALLENPDHVGDLEEDDGARVIPDGAAHGAMKSPVGAMCSSVILQQTKSPFSSAYFSE